MATPDIKPGTYTIDAAHSQVSFQVRHLMVSKVRGSFTTFEGAIQVRPDVLASSVTARVDMNSIDTRDAKRDEHLRSADFFETTQHPEMTFTSTSIEPKGDDYVLHGDLTIKGHTRPVAFDLEFNGAGGDPWGGYRLGFTAKTDINRKDFGVDIELPLDGGGVVVSDRVHIELEIEAVLAS